MRSVFKILVSTIFAISLMGAGGPANAFSAQPMAYPESLIQVQQDPCLAYHPSRGYYNQCTGGGGGDRYARNRNQDPCLAYHPSRGYYNQCTGGGGGGYGRGRAQNRPADPCLHYHPSRGYYRVC